MDAHVRLIQRGGELQDVINFLKSSKEYCGFLEKKNTRMLRQSLKLYVSHFLI